MVIRKLQTRSLGLLALFFATTVVAMAQAHFYISIAQQGTTMVASGTTDAGSAMLGYHEAHATVTLKSPSGRNSQVINWDIPSVVADAYLDLLDEDGDFTADNMGFVFCEAAQKVVAREDPNTENPVAPWAYISGAVWSEGTIPNHNGNVTLNVTVSNSNNCTGDGQFMIHLTPNPTGINIYGNPATTTILLDNTGSASGKINVHTDSTNTTSGSVSATASVQSTPGSCTVMAGKDPFTVQQPLTVPSF